jgi:hypothetical protein
MRAGVTVVMLLVSRRRAGPITDGDAVLAICR